MEREAQPVPKSPLQHRTTRTLHALQRAAVPAGSHQADPVYEGKASRDLDGPHQTKPDKYRCHGHIIHKPLSEGPEAPRPHTVPHVAQRAKTRTTTHQHKAPAADRKDLRSSTVKAFRASKARSSLIGIKKDEATEQIKLQDKTERSDRKIDKYHRLDKDKAKVTKKPKSKAHHRDWTPTDDELLQPKKARGSSSKRTAHGSTAYSRELTDSDDKEFEARGSGEHSKHQATTEEQPTKADKATQCSLGYEEESSELELPTTFRIKKEVEKAVLKAIEEGHALDYHRATRGLAHISPAKALKALSSLQSATYTNAQQHLDSYIEVVIATQHSTQLSVTQQHREAMQVNWTPRQIAEQLEAWAWRPSTRPGGLRTYEQGMFRIKDIMKHWGASEGITAKQLIQAIKVHSSRFSLYSRPNNTMLKVHRTPPVGQAEAKSYTT